MQLQNYASGQWIAGSGKQRELVDAITGDLIGTTSSGGLDFAHMLHYARAMGGTDLRNMIIPEGGRMLKDPWPTPSAAVRHRVVHGHHPSPSL